jgi:hypothetical protein
MGKSERRLAFSVFRVEWLKRLNRYIAESVGAMELVNEIV